MPIPAMIGLVLILGFVVLVIVRRVSPTRHKGNPPGEGMAGTHNHHGAPGGGSD